ncbi:DMT family transporter [Affinibrenneria salicis]|uniref:Threonine/homoserine exporter RhtA n=1 Tax=Affinibrenneria salicis TaxID=2590031 RepID=A0A5J5FZ98_9GAMM|nr:DMT family transporter [Affinibrenneria salicis]KAA8998487.1 DMT family transporter [Affinibrenneria salicis]
MNKNIGVVFVVILSAFFWGSNFNVASLVVNPISPVFAASERFFIATIFIFLVLIIKGQCGLSTIRKDIFAIAVLGLIGITGLNVAFFIGMRSTSPMNGALIMATSPMTTALLNALLDKRRVPYINMVGMAISFIGVALVISDGKIVNLARMNFRSGDQLMMFANLSMAIYTVGCKRFIKTATPLQISSFTMLSGTIGIIIFTLLYPTEPQPFSAISLQSHVLLAYMGIAGSVLAYLFWNIGINRLGVPVTSIFFNFVPIFTMLISLCQGASLNMMQLNGTILVVAGVLITTQSARIINGMRYAFQRSH